MSTSPAETFLDSIITEQPLRVADRCDRCIAQAHVVVRVGDAALGQRLYFCGHHFEQHADALMLSGCAVVQDTRQSLGSKETGVHA